MTDTQTAPAAHDASLVDELRDQAELLLRAAYRVEGVQCPEPGQHSYPEPGQHSYGYGLALSTGEVESGDGAAQVVVLHVPGVPRLALPAAVAATLGRDILDLATD